MKSLSYTFFIIILLVFSACLKDVQIAGFDSNVRHQVINAEINNTDSFFIDTYLSSSTIGQINILAPDDFKLLLYQNEEPIEYRRTIINKNKSLIKLLNNNFKPYDVVSFELNIGDEMLSAQDTLPALPEFKVEEVRNLKVDSSAIFQKLTGEIYVTLLDEVDTEDYYLVELNIPANYYVANAETPFDTQDDNTIDSIYTETKSTYIENELIEPFNHIFSDTNFNGNSLVLKLELFFYAKIRNENLNYFILNISKVSQNYFQYQKKLFIQEQGLVDAFSEPSNSHSNINNGLGIWATKTTVSDTIWID